SNGMHLLGGRIEGSGGVGLVVTTTGPGFVSTSPVRVVGGASYPAEMVVSALPRIYPLPADQDSLLGNARDTLRVTGGILQSFAYPRQALPWHVTGDITVQYYGILRPGPGASFYFDPLVRLTATNGGRLVVHGTPAAPVVFTGSSWRGITVDGTPSLGSYLTNVRIEHSLGVAALAGGSHTLVIDSAVFRQNGSAAWLWSANSRISRSRVDSTWGASPAVLLTGYNSSIESTLIRASAGPGLGVTYSVQVLSCEVRDGAQVGIMVWDASVEVNNCNLVNNGGVGISTDSPSTVNVEGNWWGDAAGPTGPSGDGVGASLDYTPWRTTPYVLPYVP
ncbi:MAG TPA: right-handed parallel beta-helix repeat-containing protein, partial [Longimicrobium sp.]|nr:right-handed parallel beta-helix repeat-containing protein [Longimicrobium sp.]